MATHGPGRVRRIITTRRGGVSTGDFDSFNLGDHVGDAPAAVADAYCASRLAGEGGRAFGTLPPGVDMAAIVERARP